MRTQPASTSKSRERKVRATMMWSADVGVEKRVIVRRIFDGIDNCELLRGEHSDVRVCGNRRK